MKERRVLMFWAWVSGHITDGEYGAFVRSSY